MTNSDLPSLLAFPGEVEVHERLFEAQPLEIVQSYLEAFDDQGRQVFEVPQHVLEALAHRFQSLMTGEHSSLDAAFGARVAQQRNRLLGDRRDWEVLCRLVKELDALKGQTRAERGAGTPLEIAAERTAEAFDMTADNVRRIYKRNGPKPRRRRSPASR